LVAYYLDAVSKEVIEIQDRQTLNTA